MASIISSAFSAVGSAFSGVVKAAAGLLETPKPPAAPEPTAAVTPDPEKAPENKTIEDRAGDFATREQMLTRQAAASGATRSDNDADLLGAVRTKKRAAARAILG